MFLKQYLNDHHHNNYFLSNQSLGCHCNLSFLLGARAYGTLVDSDTDLFCSSINGEAICIVQGSGNVVYQGEAVAGVVFRF